MPAIDRRKIRAAVKKINKELENDPGLRADVKENRIRVLAERGGLNLSEIIEAHDISWCKGTTRGCQVKLSMSR